MKIDKFLILKVFLLCVSVSFVTASFECELRDKLNRGIRGLERGSRRSGRLGQRPIKEFFENMRQKFSRRNAESSALHGLAKNIEVILSKIIPNHNLVQDLMGYVTMPRLFKEYPLEYVGN